MPFTYPSPESTLPDIEITWQDDAGNLIDMTAATFLVQVSLSEDLSESLITKTTGVAGAATAPNVTVQWSAGELSVLSSGRWYFHITATVAGNAYTYSDFLYIEGDTIRLGPCEAWVTASDLQDCADQLPAGAEACDLQLAAQYATENLWRFSGKQYGGLCIDRVRPCIGVNCLNDGTVTLDGLSNGYRYSYPSIPTRRAGDWRNISPCANGRCHLPCIILPGPVHSILQVLIDGQVLDPSAYEIAGHRRVCRTDGDKWPCNQDMSSPVTSTDTFEVTWARGTPVPDTAKRMARIYALRRVLPMICAANDCAPAAENVDLMSADGVTVDFFDTNEEARFMRTGIPVVDEWLNSVNPHQRTRRARVYRADDPARASRKFT